MLDDVGNGSLYTGCDFCKHRAEVHGDEYRGLLPSVNYLNDISVNDERRLWGAPLYT